MAEPNVTHDSHCFQRLAGHGPAIQRCTVGLRSVIRSAESTKVLASSKRENSTRITTGSIASRRFGAHAHRVPPRSRRRPQRVWFPSAAASRSLSVKKMLERAKYLLVSEMATSRNTTAESAEAIVVKSLAKAKLTFPSWTENSNSPCRLGGTSFPCGQLF